MTTQYTPILQLALPVTGELNGTWGDVVNDNITSMVEEAIAGLATISTWTANAHTLTTANGTTDEARCAMLLLQTGAGGTALSGAGQVICPARTKLYVVKNDAAYAVTVKTSGGSGVAIAAGDTAFVFCDGTNVNACVTQIVNGHITGNLTVDGTTTLNDTATTETILPAVDNTYNLGSAARSWKDIYADGQIAATVVVASFIQASNIKANDGTSSATIANSTGVMTIGSAVLTTADINGGTIDATSIGATTPSTGVFTQVDITAQGDLRLQDASGGQYVAMQAPATVPASYTLTWPDTDGDAGQALITDGSGNLSWSTAASGDVYGPASATDNAIARFDGTTGKLIQNSAVTIGDDGATVIAANSTSDGLRITQIGSGNALVVEDSANPDSTPFVVDANGLVLVGSTSSVPGAFSSTPDIQINKAASESRFGHSRFNSGVNGPEYLFQKSRNATVGGQTVVQSGDSLGATYFSGSDGTAFIPAASILASVDGTPGTNDMPGRLVFSTTADGASSPTERMRIDNQGRVGIGTGTVAGYNINIGQAITGATTTYALVNQGTINSGVTAAANIFTSAIGTQAAAFNLSNVRHFYALNTSIGAGSTVTNQFGFHAESTLTGATNNYGFYSNIAVDTGRWNFYANGTAPNFFNGSVGIGGTPLSGRSLLVGGNATGAAQTGAVILAQTIQSDSNISYRAIRSASTTAAAAFTVGELSHFMADPSPIGAGSTVTNQYGFLTNPTLTGATKNYGFYVANIGGAAATTGKEMYGVRSDVAVPSGGGLAYNFYAGGSADNYFAGNVGVGVSPTSAASSKLFVGGDVTLTTTNTVLFSNLYYSGGFKYIGNGYGSFIKLTSPINAFELFYAGNNSSGAGAAATILAGFVVDYSGNVLVTGAGGLGYGTGSGGAVTQITSRTTGVTLNKTNGAITLVSAAGSTSYQSFTVTNSTVAATDTIIVNQKSGTDLYEIFVTAVAAGSFRITFATTGGTTTEQPVFNFAVIKAVTA